jgi:undecaprenyl-diphosphatase
VRPTWLAGAAALALYLVLRRRSHGRAFLVVGALLTVVVALVGLGVIGLPNVEKLIEDIGARLGKWTYLFVGVMAYLETGAFVGLIAPGETTVIVGGLVAGQGVISLYVLIAIVWTAAVLGDLTSFTLGRRLGRDFLVRHGPRFKITEARLEHVEGFFARHGGATILIGRFIGLVRALAPFVAGASRMPLRRFLPYDVLGAGAWAITFCVLGYVFWRSFDRLTAWVSRGLFAFAFGVALIAGVVFVFRLAHSAELRQRTRGWLVVQFDRPLLRPLAPYVRTAWIRALKPVLERAARPVRFLYDRLTPGDLGLELTTLCALVAVGFFGFLFLGQAVEDDLPPAFDDAAFTIADALYSEAGKDLVIAVTWLGSWPAVAALIAVTSAWAVARGRTADAALLVVAFLVTWIAVDVAKDYFDRPRPLGSHVMTRGSAYPSGHAAYAVAWLACAVTHARLAPPASRARFSAVAAAVVLMVAIALSRVYLRAHYLSDVVGGLGLGGTIYGLAGIATVVVGYLRHNAHASP